MRGLVIGVGITCVVLMGGCSSRPRKYLSSPAQPIDAGSTDSHSEIPIENLIAEVKACDIAKMKDYRELKSDLRGDVCNQAFVANREAEIQRLAVSLPAESLLCPPPALASLPRTSLSASGKSLDQIVADVANTQSVIVIDREETISTAIVIPPGLTLSFQRPGKILFSGNGRITVQGQLWADANQQVFYYPATDRIKMNVDAPKANRVSGFQSSCVYPQWWGARGDGATNDTRAFQEMSLYVNEKKGGVNIRIPEGTYILGDQDEARPAAYVDQILLIQGIEKPVRVIGDGAGKSVLKMIDGLHFGSFEADGKRSINHANDPSFCLQNQKQRKGRHTGIVLGLWSNRADVAIRNLELDGNSTQYILGGCNGNVGYQLISYGILGYYNKNSIRIENTYIHHFGTDGIAFGDDATVTADKVHAKYLSRVTLDCNGRNAYSFVGGNGLFAINSKFNNSGRANVTTEVVPTQLFSPPGSGIDLENESGAGFIGNIASCNSEFANNSGNGIVSDGNGQQVSAKYSNFYSEGASGSYALWSHGPGFSFENTRFYGTIVHGYGSSADPGSSMKFVNCLFEDGPYGGKPRLGTYPALILIDADTPNMKFLNSTFVMRNAYQVILRGTSPLAAEGSPNGKILLKDSHFIWKPDADSPIQWKNAFLGYFQNVRFENVSFLFRPEPGFSNFPTLFGQYSYIETPLGTEIGDRVYLDKNIGWGASYVYAQNLENRCIVFDPITQKPVQFQETDPRFSALCPAEMQLDPTK